jgi:chromate transporter
VTEKMDRRVDLELPVNHPVPLTALLMAFLRLGSSSFGGGTTAWAHREIVERRQWMDEEQFLQALTVAQVMPGANPVNLAVYIGLRLRGVAGAIVAAFGMIASAFCIILLLAGLYGLIGGYPEAHMVLGGLACVGIAATLHMGVKGARRLKGQIVPLCFAAAIFMMVGLLHWPLVAVVLTVTPLSVFAAYWLGRMASHG